MFPCLHVIRFFVVLKSIAHAAAYGPDADGICGEECEGDISPPVSMLQVAMTLADKTDSGLASSANASSPTHREADERVVTAEPHSQKELPELFSVDAFSTHGERQPGLSNFPVIHLSVTSYSAAMWMMVAGMAAVLTLGFLLGWLVQCPEDMSSDTRDVRQSPPAEHMLQGHQACAINTTKDARKPALLHTIEGLRVVATLYILVYHLYNGSVFTQLFAHRVMHIFFIISGFVSALAVLNKDTYFDCREGVVFFLKRLIRLCPLYYVGLLAVAAQCATSPACRRISPVIYPLEALFLQTLWTFDGDLEFHKDNYVGNVPGWFVSDLIFLSAWLPLFTNLCPRHLRTCICALAPVLFAHPFAMIQHTNLRDIWPPFRQPEFLVGIFSAGVSAYMPPWARAWNGWSWISDAMLIVMVSILLIFCHQSENQVSLFYVEFTLVFVIGLFCISTHCAAGSDGMPVSGVLGRCLGCAPLQALAGYTYAIYILQIPAFSVCDYWMRPPWMPPCRADVNTVWHPEWKLDQVETRPLFRFMGILMYVGFATMVGVIADHLIQRPIQRKLEGYLRR